MAEEDQKARKNKNHTNDRETMQERGEEQGAGGAGSRKLPAYRWKLEKRHLYAVGNPWERLDLPLFPWTHSLY